ncbi:MAG: rod shape-determining protein MreD [Gammaproteobacteria bacterium]|nr:rod shape-determining protein MreD [Gammaproteobacteria bacterium]
MIRSYSVILPTFFVALVLAAFPMPRLIDYIRPEWVAMTMIFWLLVSPYKAGIFLAFAMGVLLDVLHGNLLGLNALALSLMAYLVLLLHSRMRLYNAIQQSFLVFVLIGLFLLVRFWAESVVIGQSKSALLWPSVGSALIWPLWYNLLAAVRQYFRT